MCVDYYINIIINTYFPTISTRATFALLLTLVPHATQVLVVCIPLYMPLYGSHPTQHATFVLHATRITLCYSAARSASTSH